MFMCESKLVLMSKQPLMLFPRESFCRARRVKGTVEFYECLVEKRIHCPHRASFSGGNYCLHTSQAEIASKTLQAEN